MATQDFLQGWNIALIVIGAVAFVIGDGIAAFLGTMLAMRSALLTGEWLRHACACMYMYIYNTNDLHVYVHYTHMLMYCNSRQPLIAKKCMYTILLS